MAAMRRFLLLLIVTTSVHVATAQNSDLGLLTGLGYYHGASSGVEVNYAWQFWEHPVGRLYVEVPAIIIPVRGGSIACTPGIRFHHNITQRIALYAAVGVGIASPIREPADLVTGVDLAYDLGGGVDFRLNRRWSLRADIRESSQGASSIGHLVNPTNWDRNPKSALLGVALHF